MEHNGEINYIQKKFQCQLTEDPIHEVKMRSPRLQGQRRSGTVFFLFFGLSAVVFAVTVVWVVLRTLDVRWAEDGESLYGSSLVDINSPAVGNPADFRVPATEEERLEILNSRLNGSSTGALFRRRPVIIWSNDYHISPIHDLKHLLVPQGVVFIDKSLSYHCGKTASCAKDLRVIQRESALELHPALISKFHMSYSQDPEMQSVDAFVCFHPAAMCELFMPFNKSILVIASTRYEMGRLKPDRWTQWNSNLLTISKDKKNLVAANNLYDAKYIQYFTGIEPVLLPCHCGYIKERYNPTRKGFLLGPIHNQTFQDRFMTSFNSSRKELGLEKEVKLMPIRTVYNEYKYNDLVAHQGIVHLPYQVSTMSILEQYTMAIPMFFPSLELLSEWHLKYQVLKERTWDGVEGEVPVNSSILPHPSQIHIPDPNCDTDLVAIKHWLQFADFYQMPHITYYSSLKDLVEKLQKTDLNDISAKMKEFREQSYVSLTNKWKHILYNIAKYSNNKPS